jgi:hypothetical protein
VTVRDPKLVNPGTEQGREPRRDQNFAPSGDLSINAQRKAEYTQMAHLNQTEIILTNDYGSPDVEIMYPMCRD